jgi:hypothetical protein
MISDETNIPASARRGVVLSGLTQQLDLGPLVPEDLRGRLIRRSPLPDDANSKRLASLLVGGSINDVMAELGRLDELYPGKYRLPTVVQSAPLLARDVRTYLTLWDVVDYPDIVPYSPAIDADADAEIGESRSLRHEDLTLLVDQGFIVRSRIRADDTGGITECVERTHRAAYAVRAAAEPACWSMARDLHSKYWRGRDEEQGRGALVRLYDCIPIPDADVPIYEILEFKERRRDELLSLRYHLESIYQRILVAGDRGLSLETEIGQLERSLTEYLRAGRDSRMPFRMLNLTSQIKLQFDLRTGVAVGAVAYASGLPLLATVLAGIGGAFFPKLEISVTSAPRSVKSTPNPYAYITSIREELFR